MRKTETGNDQRTYFCFHLTLFHFYFKNAVFFPDILEFGTFIFITYGYKLDAYDSP